MTIRILTDADVPAFHRIRRRALQEEPQAFSMMPDEMASVETLVERFKANWDGQSAFVMGAFGPELVAIVGCARAHHIKRRHAAEVWGMYVVPEYRGHGIGRRLLVDAVARARRVVRPGTALARCYGDERTRTHAVPVVRLPGHRDTAPGAHDRRPLLR